jgi:branched-subunit amino acid ABC-type transport system permease component
MCAQEFAQPPSFASRVEGLFTWLGGGHWRELGERHERSTHAVAGAVVMFGAALAWLVAGLAVSESARWPLLAIVPLALLFGLLVGAVTRGVASGPVRSRPGIAGRVAVAVAVGVVVGELAALVLFSNSIDRRLHEQALRNADSAPAVAQASASLQQTRDARGRLDSAVEQAREHQDRALIVARCEYNPTPACPQTRITGVPGAGPETRTANELLADTQHELDNALAARDRQAPDLDAKISLQQQTVAEARQNAVAEAGGGLGARWVAMNGLMFASTGAWVLRLLTIAFFALVYLLPLILRQWRGETTHDRHATARADRERAELEAETAIAIKQAEVRREAEIMWAEHQLTQARLAIEAQTEIDREHQRRRVMDALDAPVHTSSAHTSSRGTFEPVENDMYLPIAAEAEAASRSITQVPANAQNAGSENLPARIEPGGEVEPHDERSTPLIPSIPDATKAAARWIRPLVPPFVARVIDNTTQPLRTARQVFEEVEEITFSLKRHRKVTVDSETSVTGEQAPSQAASGEIPAGAGRRIASSREEPDQQARHAQRSSLPRSASDTEGLSLGSVQHERRPALAERDGPGELRAPEGPRQLPPASDWE